MQVAQIDKSCTKENHQKPPLQLQRVEMVRVLVFTFAPLFFMVLVELGEDQNSIFTRSLRIYISIKLQFSYLSYSLGILCRIVCTL